jgi:hypothetical protein
VPDVEFRIGQGLGILRRIEVLGDNLHHMKLELGIRDKSGAPLP